MEARLNTVTLGVADVARAMRFYKDGLGWKPVLEAEDFALFDLGGVLLALYPRDLLAQDAGVAPGSHGFAGVTLGQNVSSRALVDRTIASACAAGATLLRAATEKTWGGYSGYFADPDGHPWEIVYAPQFRLENGRLVL